MGYTPDYSSQQAKHDELVQLVAGLLDEKDKAVAEKIVDLFCSLTPPQDPPIRLHLVTMNSFGYEGGESRKPGNLRLNWKKLFSELPDIGLNIAGVVAAPALIPLAALSLWNKVWSHSAIPLSREHATVLYAMWQGRDGQNRIERTQALEKSGVLFGLYGWPQLDAHAFESILSELEGIQCVEREESSIWLREWVKTSYN